MSTLWHRVKQFWVLFFFVLAIGFVVYYMQNEFSRVRTIIHLSRGWIVFAAVFHAGFLLLATANWRRIVKLSVNVSLGLHESFRQLAIVSVGKYLPGKVWGAIARGAVLARRGAGTREILLATFHEQYLLLAASVLVCLLCVALLAGPGVAWVIACLGGLAFIASFYGQATGLRVFGYFANRIGREHKKAMDSFEWSRYSVLCARFIILWVLNGLIFAGLYLAIFPESLTIGRVSTLLLANTAGITAGFLALFAPAGIGVREGVSGAILSSIMPLADALMLGLVFRLWVTVVDLGLAVAIIPELRLRACPSQP